VIALCVAAVAVLMIVTWLVSLAMHDASIVDIVWGLNFVVVAVVAAVAGDGAHARSVLLLGMVGLWGLRLSGYLARRNLGHGEDFRYQAMRRKYGDRFGLISLVVVFGLQGVLALVVSLPVQLAATTDQPESLGPLAVLGVILWAVGFAFESIGDAQLARFKRDPSSAGQVMDRGLWRYTRHPNYFGDFCIWWGVFLVAAETVPARWGVVGPLLMSFLLLRVSGVALLESTITSRRPGYAEYVERTSAFFPRPPEAT